MATLTGASGKESEQCGAERPVVVENIVGKARHVLCGVVAQPGKRQIGPAFGDQFVS